MLGRSEIRRTAGARARTRSSHCAHRVLPNLAGRWCARVGELSDEGPGLITPAPSAASRRADPGVEFAHACRALAPQRPSSLAEPCRRQDSTPEGSRLVDRRQQVAGCAISGKMTACCLPRSRSPASRRRRRDFKRRNGHEICRKFEAPKAGGRIAKLKVESLQIVFRKTKKTAQMGRHGCKQSDTV